MNKKNLVLICKCCLLFAFIGFCLPIFNGSSGFYYLFRYLKSNTNVLVESVGHGVAYDEASNKVDDIADKDFYPTLDFAKNQLNKYDEKNSYLIPELDAIKEDVAADVKVIKEDFEPTLKAAKAAKKSAIKAAKDKYRSYKPSVKAEVASIKNEYNLQKSDIKSKIKSAKDDKKPETVIKDFEAQLTKLKKDSGAKISQIENRLSNIKKNGISAARKEYAKVEGQLNAQIKLCEDRYWVPFDAYNNPRELLKNQVKCLTQAKYVPVLLIIFLAGLILSIVFTVLQFVVLKKDNDYGKLSYIVDIILLLVTVISALLAFRFIKTISLEWMVDGYVVSLGGGSKPFSFGYYIAVVGLVLAVVFYTFSITLDENISSTSEERRAYWVLALPALLFYFAVMTFPAIFSVFLSFTNYSGGSIFARHAMDFIGFDNYIKVFEDPYFYISLKNNCWIVLISVFGQLPLGFILAYVLNTGLVKGRDFFQTMIYLPCVISTVVIGILFQSFFSAKGAWTDILRFFNPEYKWTMGNHPIVPVLFVILWMYTGTYLIIFLANLQKIDPAVREAAMIDGASEGQVLVHIIFPELSGTFVISSILAISGSLKSFDLIYVMTAGGPARKTSVLSLYMFDMAFKGQADYPMANTISTIMVVISLVLIAIVKTLEKKFGASDDD